MGFLHESEPLDWDDALRHLRFVRDHGIEQFLHIFHQVKHVNGDLLRWGDEIEHAIFKLVGDSNDDFRTIKVSLRSPEVIQALKAFEQHGRLHGLSDADMSSWMPEYGRWMLESTPRKPYEGLVDLLKVEDCMRMRRSRLLAALNPGEISPTVSCLPIFGVGDFCEPSKPPGGDVTESLFLPDGCIFPHPRFATLTKNIRKRRGSKVAIRRRKYEDTQTKAATVEDVNFIPETVAQADEMDHVYADSMGFGMGCCCLQITFQASNVSESRHLYDHLSVLTPLMLALTASTPFLRGWLMDEDSRWDTVAQSVDDRTPAEMGETSDSVGDDRMAGGGTRHLRKSRYDSIDCYLCNCRAGQDMPAQLYNDLAITSSEEHVARLMNTGIDEVLARHIAHLFARDPLVIFKDRIFLDDRLDIDHWENLQSTNWQTVRWKPPPPQKGVLATSSEDHIGWRVEFRSMEIQITDFENAAFAVMVMLLSRVVLAFELNLYIPISCLEENMRIAQRRGACPKECFWFRKDILPEKARIPNKQKIARGRSLSDSSARMTLQDIFEGNGDFVGLMPLCESYLSFIGCDSVVRSGLQRYMDFILKRARGELMTPATWMRKFITSHPDYKNDSRIPSTVAYDLMVACKDIGEGRRHCPDLLGDVKMPLVEPASTVTNQSSSSSSAGPGANKIQELLDRFREKAEMKRAATVDDEMKKKQEDIDRLIKEIEALKHDKSSKAAGYASSQ
jgi:glutamate--cysteine ligase catalytic subunit